MKPTAPLSRALRIGPAAAGLALMLVACHPSEKPLAHNNQPPSVAGRVQVLNADTLVIDGRHVHLANASAPEGAIHARCWAEAMLASTEIVYVKDLVAHAQSIDFKPNGQVDSYNRALGQVMIDGGDLGEDLYEHGMAARLTEPRFDWCQPVSQAAEGAPPSEALVRLGE